MDGSFCCQDDDSNSSGSGGGGGSFLSEQEEPHLATPDQYIARGFPAGGPPLDHKLSPPSTAPALAAGASSSSQKRSGCRRSVHKQVVSVPIADADGARSGKGTGEGAAPPSDSWAWRKYGQKPIKGSPYPRGYYRCSSSKGCPARKQVERSRTDPTMLVVSYTCEHNHPWPLPKLNSQHHQQQQKQPSPAAAASPSKPTTLEDAPALPGPPPTSPPEESFATDLLGEDNSLAMMADDFGWFSDVSASPPAAEAFLGGIDGAGMMPPGIQDDDVQFGSAGDDEGDEESSLFAGLGELPECAVVFRRAFLERQVRMQMEVEEDRRRVAAATPCIGGTG